MDEKKKELSQEEMKAAAGGGGQSAPIDKLRPVGPVRPDLPVYKPVIKNPGNGKNA